MELPKKRAKMIAQQSEAEALRSTPKTVWHGEKPRALNASSPHAMWLMSFKGVTASSFSRLPQAATAKVVAAAATRPGARPLRAACFQ